MLATSCPARLAPLRSKNAARTSSRVAAAPVARLSKVGSRARVREGRLEAVGRRALFLGLPLSALPVLPSARQCLTRPPAARQVEVKPTTLALSAFAASVVAEAMSAPAVQVRPLPARPPASRVPGAR